MRRSIPFLASFATVVLLFPLVFGAPAGQSEVDDELTALTLAAEGERFDVLRDLLASRTSGVAALRRAGERAAGRGRVQTAWLAEALAVLAGPSTAATDRERAARVVRLLRDRGDTAQIHTPPRDLFLLHGPECWRSSRESEEAAAKAVRRRVDAMLALAGDPAVAPERVRPWLEHVVDDEAMPGDLRLAAARPLLRIAGGDAVPRVHRLFRECRRDPVRDLFGAFMATGSEEAARFLLRVEASPTRDPRDYSPARAALDAMESAHPTALAAAREDVLRLFHRYEAESAPMCHSTGAAVKEGWAARRGQDAPQHMLYGPYVSDLPSRFFRARFRFRVDGVAKDAGDRPILRLDATSPEMERQGWPIASRTVLEKDVTIGAWQEAEVRFWTHPKPARMEFRVFWSGLGDVVVDRVDLLEVTPEGDDERAGWPPRVPWPKAAAPPPAKLRPETARLLFGKASESQGARYEALRDALLSDPETARGVLTAAASGSSEPAGQGPEAAQRAWLAGVLLGRLARSEEFVRLRAALDERMTALESQWTVPGWSEQVPSPQYPIYRRELETGGAMIGIRDRQPRAEGVIWLNDLPVFPGGPVSHLPQEAPSPAVVEPLPASPLWATVFAEVWLTGERPPPLPSGVDPAVIPPDPSWDPRSRRIQVLPFSTVGHRRLHALQWLALLGERRARPALAALRDDPAATVAERQAASRRLADLDR
ncbi:MAG: hypothetical protein MUE73_16025 [Planctomycetes bacterium]|nr:hypothetical protein [Planctomycetota bacterium]